MPRRRKPISPTLREQDVFLLLWMLRVMTLEQIRRARYVRDDSCELTSTVNLRKNLKALCDEGYLRSVRLPSKENVYFLGEQSLPLLFQRFGISQKRLYGSRLDYLDHPLLVSECAVRITESLRKTPLKLAPLSPYDVPFYTSFVVEDPRKRKHKERFVTHEDVAHGGVTYHVRPDLVFAIQRETLSKLYFVEADRGFEGHQQIAKKVAGYHYYKEYGRWKRYSEVLDFRVLFVTTTDTRIRNLRRSLRRVPGFELVLFSTAETLSDSNMVFDSVWSRPDGSSGPLAAKPQDQDSHPQSVSCI